MQTKSGNIQLTVDLHRVKRDLLGPSGMIRAGGTQVQFKSESPSIILDGPSGFIMSDGTLVQRRSKRSTAGWVLPKGNLGYSGILRADGTYEQFSHDFAHDILLLGPSGIVTKNGNIQLTDDLHRVKRDLIGPSGMILSDGTQVQFKTESPSVLLDGPSGLVMSDGTLVQRRSKRANVGPSGMILPDGTPVQFPAHAEKVLAGPSGIVFSTG